MTLTISDKQALLIAATIAPMRLPSGLGTEANASVMAAINIALGNGLVDDVPDSMSPVLGRWLIVMQDRMPAAMRNSAAFKDLAPYAAGTGRAHEAERLAIIREHMWAVALPLVQPVADKGGYGSEWRRMCIERTDVAARAAAEAARAAARAAEAAEALAARAAAAAAAAVSVAALVAALVSVATLVSVEAVADVVEADAWDILTPIGLLRQLIEVTHTITEPPPGIFIHGAHS